MMTARRHDDDVFHFITHAVCGTRALQLDGLWPGPVILVALQLPARGS